MDIFEDYAKQICTTCKAKECNKGICMLVCDHLEVRCVDYVKDESRIIPIQHEVFPMAKKTNPVNKRFM